MRTLGDSLKKSFEPTALVKVENLKGEGVAKGLLLEIYQSLKEKHNTLLDTERGVIYLREREKKGGGK